MSPSPGTAQSNQTNQTNQSPSSSQSQSQSRAQSRTRARLALGRWGEEQAAAHLVSQGMSLLDQNWRCAQGEVDLVLRDGDVLVVCEVKTRTSVSHGTPHEAVDERKVARLRRLAALWVRERGVHPRDVRIDMVAVLRPRRGDAVLEHVRGLG